MDGLHVIITENLKTGQKSNFVRGNGVITLQQAGTFTVSIKEFDDSARLINDKLAALYQERDLTKADPEKFKSISNTINKLNNQFNALKDKFAGVRWIYQTVDADVELTKDSYNKSFGKGTVMTTVEFSDLWEGGGLVYIEPYFYDPVINPADPKGPKIQMQPHGKAPFGCFIKGRGESKVATAEWKDKEGRLITGKVAFGSTVYLHIYTRAMYGQALDITLKDGHTFTKDRNLHLTEGSEDGHSARLDPLADDSHFVRKVSVYPFLNEVSRPPKGATLGEVIDSEGKKLDNGRYKKIPHVQKCVFAVFIERKWQYTGSNYEESFSIHPSITLHNVPGGRNYDLSDVELEITEDGFLYAGDLKGNSPVTVSELKMENKKDPRERKDFIIGMFFDGTLNSLYNTEARQAFEKKHPEFPKLESRSQKIVDRTEKNDPKDQKGRYKYEDENSYENDLSNPAIIYKDYIVDKVDNTFKVYTEGIGTNTRPAADGKLYPENYKTDDTIGYGLGEGRSGIIAKVHLGITKAVDQIIQNLEPNETIGTLTFDVFGFSRGAAAARNFVHEITLQPYSPTVKYYEQPEKKKAFDRNNYPVDIKYGTPNKLLPACGHLGYLLTQVNKTFDSLVIRFAGLFDTVPHQGFLQSNDIEDLGLKDIMQAKYTVHLVAADEHRANFSLVDIRCITGKIGGGESARGIELYLPGVHCDVGGSYQDQKPENKNRMDVIGDYHKIKELKYELIRQGWFNEGELFITDDTCKELITDSNYKDYGKLFVLNSKRENVSNQYSFIPLYMMLEFCKEKDIPVNGKITKNNYKFSKKNKDFLDGIWGHLKIHKEYTFKEPPVFKQPDIVYDSQNPSNALTQYHLRQIKGQELLNKKTDLENTDIKRLRNSFLHWNSVYGEGFWDTYIQPYKPNIVSGKRKRTIRG